MLLIVKRNSSEDKFHSVGESMEKKEIVLRERHNISAKVCAPTGLFAYRQRQLQDKKDKPAPSAGGFAALFHKRLSAARFLKTIFYFFNA